MAIHTSQGKGAGQLHRHSALWGCISPFQKNYWLLLVYMVNVLYLSVFISF